MRLQCSSSAANVLVLDSFFMKLVQQMTEAEAKKATTRAAETFNKVLRFKGVKDMFAFQYVLLPFCNRWGNFL
jgi:hypothetical protein